MMKAHFKLFMLSLLLMLGVASCKDNDNSSDSDEAVVTEMVDPSTNWKHRDDPTFMAGIEGAPLAFQQALSSTFPQKAGSLGDAYIAVVGFSWALAHLEELNEFYDGGGLLLLLPPKDDDLPELGYESFVDWDELIWGTHTLYEDIFYLLDAPDEMTVVNEENQEVTVRTDKDLNYYNTRLTALVEWIDAFGRDILDDAADSRSWRASNRAQDSGKPNFDTMVLNLKKGFYHYSVNFPFSANVFIDKGTAYSPDYLKASASVTMSFDVMPLYMGSVNGEEKAGDYYAVRSRVIPHNNSMWVAKKVDHVASQIRIYGFWFNTMDYEFSLIDPSTNDVAAGTRFQELPYPANSTSSRDHTNEFSFGISGSVSGGKNLGGDKGGGKIGGNFGFSCQWKNAIKYTLKNIDYTRNSETNIVTYHWNSNNVTLSDHWDDVQRDFPEDVRREFEAENVWMWHIPYDSVGVADESTKAFHLKARVRLNYSTWYHWRWAIEYNENRRDWNMAFGQARNKQGNVVDASSANGWASCTFKLPVPDRGKWGLLTLRNDATHYTMRNVMVYKSGEEDKTPVASLNQFGYASKETAETVLPVGTYTVTFELVDPDFNTLKARGTLKNVEVTMSKSKEDATAKRSTSLAEIEVVN